MRPITYNYIVERSADKREPWLLAVLLPNGRVDPMATYRQRGRAVSAARVLAGRTGKVEVRT